LSSIDVPVALLGYGTVGSAVNRLLVSNADEIERATGHRLRVVRALVRDPAAERAFLPDPSILTTDFRAVADDPEIRLVAEVMGGLDPAGEHVLELLHAGRSVSRPTSSWSRAAEARLSPRRRRPASNSARGASAPRSR
jgi:homoserine dehydrogenase